MDEELIITATNMLQGEKYEFNFLIDKKATEKEKLDKAFENAMYKYGDIEELEIISEEEL